VFIEVLLWDVTTFFHINNIETRSKDNLLFPTIVKPQALLNLTKLKIDILITDYDLIPRMDAVTVPPPWASKLGTTIRDLYSDKAFSCRSEDNYHYVNQCLPSLGYSSSFSKRYES
jgi:hypothetical protein